MIARPPVVRSVGPTFVVASSDKSKASQEVEGEERGRRPLSAFLPWILPPFLGSPIIRMGLLPDPYRARLPVGKSTKDFHGH